MSLNIVLSAYKVPKEVAPVHEVYLIGEKEPQVLGSCRQVTFFLHTAHPVLVGLGVSF